MKEELSQEEAIARMEAFASARKPFIFVISYDKSRAFVEALDDIDPSEMLYDFSGISNIPPTLSASETAIEWQFTPDTPLLPGTMRQYLLDRGLIKSRRILATDLPHYQKVSLINAMMQLGDLCLDIKKVED